MSWEIVETDIAEKDREAAVLFVLRLRGPDYTQHWHDGLLAAIAALAQFPGPRAYPRFEQEEQRRRQETRLLLYGGPDRRLAPSVTYKVLFTVLDPVQGEEAGTILIQRIRHARRGDAEETEEK